MSAQAKLLERLREWDGVRQEQSRDDSLNSSTVDDWLEQRIGGPRGATRNQLGFTQAGAAGGRDDKGARKSLRFTGGGGNVEEPEEEPTRDTPSDHFTGAERDRAVVRAGARTTGPSFPKPSAYAPGSTFMGSPVGRPPVGVKVGHGTMARQLEVAKAMARHDIKKGAAGPSPARKPYGAPSPEELSAELREDGGGGRKKELEVVLKTEFDKILSVQHKQAKQLEDVTKLLAKQTAQQGKKVDFAGRGPAKPERVAPPVRPFKTGGKPAAAPKVVAGPSQAAPRARARNDRSHQDFLAEQLRQKEKLKVEQTVAQKMAGPQFQYQLKTLMESEEKHKEAMDLLLEYFRKMSSQGGNEDLTDQVAEMITALARGAAQGEYSERGIRQGLGRSRRQHPANPSEIDEIPSRDPAASSSRGHDGRWSPSNVHSNLPETTKHWLKHQLSAWDGKNRCEGLDSNRADVAGLGDFTHTVRDKVMEYLEQWKEDLDKKTREYYDAERKRQAWLDHEAKKESDRLEEERDRHRKKLDAEHELARMMLEDEVRRPNHYINEAESGVKRIEAELLPMLEKAEAALRRLKGHQYVQNIPLLSRISAQSANKIVERSEALTEMVLDDLLQDTVVTLQAMEERDRRDEEATLAGDRAVTVDRFVSDIDREERDLASKWGLDFGGRPRLLQEDGTGTARTRLAASRVGEAPAPRAPAPHARAYAAPAAGAPARGVPAVRPAGSQEAGREAGPPPPAAAPASPVAAPSSAAGARPAAAPTPAGLNAGEMEHLIERREFSGHVTALAVDDIMSARDKFMRYQRDYSVVSAVQGFGLQQWEIVERFADDILDDVLGLHSGELGTIFDGIVEGMFRSEFAQPQQ